MLDAFGSSYLDKAVVATRAARPIPASLCCICICPDNVRATNVWYFLLNLRTDVDASDTDTVTESALKPEWGWDGKSCRTGESYPGQQRASWLFIPTAPTEALPASLC